MSHPYIFNKNVLVSFALCNMLYLMLWCPQHLHYPPQKPHFCCLQLALKFLIYCPYFKFITHLIEHMSAPPVVFCFSFKIDTCLLHKKLELENILIQVYVITNNTITFIL
jgi:hypothetical protein